jgi:hypothetical protein
MQSEKVLYFQIDSVLCSNSSYNLTEFLDYDFIGAPWYNGGCCNGELSIRSRRKMLEIVQSDRTHNRLHENNEDVCLMNNLPDINDRLAPVMIAQRFSVESIFHSRLFGVHKPYVEILGPIHMKRLCNECPEVKLILSHSD